MPFPSVHLPHPLPSYYQLDYTNGNNACGPTALAMVIDYNSENPIGAQAVIDYAIEHRLYDPTGEMYDPSFTSPAHLYQLAQHYGTPRQGWVQPNNSADALRTLLKHLRQGHPVIVDVTVKIESNDLHPDAHYVVVTGIAGRKVYLYDPYGLGKKEIQRTVDWNDFFWAWMNNSDEPYGGIGWWMILLPNWTGRR